ncbi:hypothetical protein CYMTET_16003 [Cymbomonas tetramitiformis]|uniref:Uncharacterized protein n=1 Tax=Cymbomonas tetramitiformis TaxID=36881 RepID=A0AAE0GDF0_9CHLO|nr:hypothetical protein CYMTET_16003 [Cymbomonas tetramitiformis]
MKLDNGIKELAERKTSGMAGYVRYGDIQGNTGKTKNLLDDMRGRRETEANKKQGHVEKTMGHLTGEHGHWPGVSQQDKQHGEVNPDEDIYPGENGQTQIRTEGENSYNYNDKGRPVLHNTRGTSFLAGSAWDMDWKGLGAYQFNSEYEHAELHKAMAHTIAATNQEKPTFGVKPTAEEAIRMDEEGSKADIRWEAVKRWKSTFQEVVIDPETFGSLFGEYSAREKE